MGRPIEPPALARSADLVYVDDSMPGFQRLRWGRGFTYRDPEGQTVKSTRLRDRFASLAVPPAWNDVWICADEHGHLQSTGRDEKKRKQYIYHPRWLEVANRAKFDRMIDFGRSLPALRRTVARDMGRRKLSHRRVTAAAVRVMDQGLIRVGNPRYARQNRSYGLTTLRSKHVEIEGCTVSLQYRGKSGQDRALEISDCRVAHLLKRCHELPGQQLLQYTDGDGRARPIGSGDVNRYLREVTERDVTAKDFRTWGGTALATALFADLEPPADPESTAATKQKAVIVREVAEALGNTPATARTYYIHPDVFDAWSDGRLAALADRFEPTDDEWFDEDEQLTLALLEELGAERRGESRRAA